MKPKHSCACSSTLPMPGARERFFNWAGFSRRPLVAGRGGAPGPSPSNAVSTLRGPSAIDPPKPGRCIELGSRALCLGDAGTARALVEPGRQTS